MDEEQLQSISYLIKIKIWTQPLYFFVALLHSSKFLNLPHLLLITKNSCCGDSGRPRFEFDQGKNLRIMFEAVSALLFFWRNHTSEKLPEICLRESRWLELLSIFWTHRIEFLLFFSGILLFILGGTKKILPIPRSLVEDVNLNRTFLAKNKQTKTKTKTIQHLNHHMGSSGWVRGRKSWLSKLWRAHSSKTFCSWFCVINN